MNAEIEQFLVLNVVAGTTPVNVPRCLQKTSGPFWLCKDCEESGKKLLRKGPDDINAIGSKLDCIQRQLTERQLNENTFENTVQKFIEERILHFEQKLVNKINLVIEKQQQIPEQIKTSWQKAVYRLLYQT